MTEQTQDANKLIAERRAKLENIRENCSANAHPNKFRREHYSDDLQQEFGEFEKEKLIEMDTKVSIAGRIMAKRGPFMLLQDMKGRIQAYAAKDVQKDLKEKYGVLDIGDIIGVSGAILGAIGGVLLASNLDTIIPALENFFGAKIFPASRCTHIVTKYNPPPA